MTSLSDVTYGGEPFGLGLEESMMTTQRPITAMPGIHRDIPQCVSIRLYHFTAIFISCNQ